MKIQSNINLKRKKMHPYNEIYQEEANKVVKDHSFISSTPSRLLSVKNCQKKDEISI